MREFELRAVGQLGMAIRQARKEAGFTQRDAAAFCNVSLPFLSKVEQGKAGAQIGKVIEVCLRLGIAIRIGLPESGQ